VTYSTATGPSLPRLENTSNACFYLMTIQTERPGSTCKPSALHSKRKHVNFLTLKFFLQQTHTLPIRSYRVPKQIQYKICKINFRSSSCKPQSSSYSCAVQARLIPNLSYHKKYMVNWHLFRRNIWVRMGTDLLLSLCGLRGPIPGSRPCEVRKLHPDGMTWVTAKI
jgi:hypothetical protein